MSISTVHRQDAGMKVAGRNVGGQFKSHERTAAPSFLPSGTQYPLVTDQARAALALVTREFPGANITVDESPIFDYEKPEGNVSILVGNQCVGIGDLTFGNISLEEREEGILSRAEYALDLDRLARLRGLDESITPDLDSILKLELVELTGRTTDYQMSSRWAPGNLLATSDGPIHVLEEQGSMNGIYRVTVEAVGDNVRVTQTIAGAEVPRIDTKTLHAYRRESEEWLSHHLCAEVTIQPDGTFQATRTQTLMAGTVATVENVHATIETSGGHMHDFGKGVTGIDPDLLYRYLKEHEVIDNSRFADVRDAWISEQSPKARAEAIGYDRLDAEEWAAAMWVSYSSETSFIAPVEMREFIYQGRVDRAGLREAAEEVSEQHKGEFGSLCAELANRLSRGGLIDREPPRIAPRAY